MSNIFAQYAPLYWGAGLPVIPLVERDKRPILNDWPRFGSEFPEENIREHWLNMYPRANIGLPFGAASGLCAIDIDLDKDDPMFDALLDILPASPWHRVGKKGVGLIYKWSGQKNFKLRGEEGGMICEFLGLGNQMVVPPSIHPDTGQAYVASADLWDVLGGILPLPDNIDSVLRDLLGTRGFTISRGSRSGPVDVVPEGERDVQMTRHAGYLARVVLGIDKTTQIGLMDAINHMQNWVIQYTAKTGGDDMDAGKGIGKLLEFLIKDLDKGKTLPEGWDNGLTEDWLEHESIIAIRKKNQVARWTLVKARSWLNEKVAENASDDDWVLARVQELIGNIAKDDKFTETDFRALIPHITAVMGGMKLGKSDLLQAYKAARKGAEGGEEWEDHETIARTVLEQIQRFGEVRFDHEEFWQWNGSCFEKLSEATIYMYIAINIKGSKLVQRHNDYASIIKVLSRMANQKLEEAEENGINFANGWVGEDLVVREHAPKYGATFTLPFEYKPELATKANRFFEFLHDCWGSEHDFNDRVKALQEFFAAAIFGIAPQFQRALLLYGRAGTGKTVLLRIFRSLLPPDGVADLGPQFWGERFALTALVGKAINICGELPESGAISGQMFKNVVEGSECPTEFKGRDIFVFKPKCANIFASNFMPVSRDSSNGFTRRWLILDFTSVVAENDQIKTLAEDILADEREAIAAWAMEGLSRLLKAGNYTLPDSHKMRENQLRRINNTVKAFFESDDKLQFMKDAVCMARQLYDRYSFYMKDIGRGNGVGYERFIQMIEDLGVDVSITSDGLGNNEWTCKGVRICTQ